VLVERVTRIRVRHKRTWIDIKEHGLMQ